MYFAVLGLRLQITGQKEFPLKEMKDQTEAMLLLIMK
jgi:hypothetical protein